MIKAAKLTFLGALGLFLMAPLVVVAGVSFNGSQRINFPPKSPSWIWYQTFFGDQAWVSDLTRSLVIAAAAAVVSVSIAAPIAYAAWRYRSRAAHFLESAARISFILPAIVQAILFLVFWSWLRHGGRIEDTILSHAVVFVTLPLTTLGLGFRSVDPALVDAARTMGATEAYVMRTVLRPIVLPYAVSGLVFVFILSLNEYIIAYMVAGFEVETLPIKVFNNLRMGFQPTMCVGAVLFMLLSLLGFSLIAAIGDLPKLMGGTAENRSAR